MFSSPGCPGESGGPSELRVLGAIGRHFVELAWLGGRRAWGRLVEAGWCVSLQVLRGGATRVMWRLPSPGLVSIAVEPPPPPGPVLCFPLYC